MHMRLDTQRLDVFVTSFTAACFSFIQIARPTARAIVMLHKPQGYTSTMKVMSAVLALGPTDYVIFHIVIQTYRAYL